MEDKKKAENYKFDNEEGAKKEDLNEEELQRLVQYFSVLVDIDKRKNPKRKEQNE